VSQKLANLGGFGGPKGGKGRGGKKLEEGKVWGKKEGNLEGN